MERKAFFNGLRQIGVDDPDRHWPHDLEPGAWSDGVEISERGNALIPTEANWNALGYNPPALAIALFPDADTRTTVRPKPTWDQVAAAADKASLTRERDRWQDRIGEEETRRICAAYIGDQDVPQTVEQEILYRLRASVADLAPKDAERDRLHGRAAGLKTWIKDSGRTLAELEAFDPTADTHWQDVEEET